MGMVADIEQYLIENGECCSRAIVQALGYPRVAVNARLNELAAQGRARRTKLIGQPGSHYTKAYWAAVQRQDYSAPISEHSRALVMGAWR